MNVLIKFKKLNQICIRNIMREKFKYDLNNYEMNMMCNNFLFSSDNFVRRVGDDCSGILSLELEVHRIAREIGEEYSFIKEEVVDYDGKANRFIIEVIGGADRFGSYGNRFYGGFIDEGWNPTYNSEPLMEYLENDRKAVLDAFKRIPKTFDVYSGYSKDGRLRTVVHWGDRVKTDVYLNPDNFNDLYLAIAYCYVKRKFGNLSHFKRIVERNTKEVTSGVKRFIYGGDSTLLVPVMNFSIYDQVALYLAISYLGDTDQWLTEEDKERLEDSVNE